MGSEWECSKKSVQQGRSHFDARSVQAVREHGKMARTPLAAFFNIPRKSMSEFVLYVLELLTPLKDIRSRKMFGGYGIFRKDVMFGLVADDVLHFKADHQTIPEFEKLGLGPFLYEKNGKMIPLSYYQVPEETMDSSEELCDWAKKAHAAALRAKKQKTKTVSRQQATRGPRKKS